MKNYLKSIMIVLLIGIIAQETLNAGFWDDFKKSFKRNYIPSKEWHFLGSFKAEDYNAATPFELYRQRRMAQQEKAKLAPIKEMLCKGLYERTDLEAQCGGKYWKPLYEDLQNEYRFLSRKIEAIEKKQDRISNFLRVPQYGFEQ